MRRQTRSQNSRAFTELEMGDEDLEKTNCNIAMDTMIWSPATTEQSEKEKADPKQEAKPGDICRKEERCLNIYILLNIYQHTCYPSYDDQKTRWNINHNKVRSE